MIGTARARPIAHDDRLSVVHHLDELRTRIIVSLLALGISFGLCFWQNSQLLRLINAPLAHETQQQARHGQGPLGAAYLNAQSTRDVAMQLRKVLAVVSADPAARTHSAQLLGVDAALDRDIGRLAATPQSDRPVTLGIGEPLTTTATVSFIFALILALPILLSQAFAFLAPALTPTQRRQLRPLTVAVPGLFIAGVAFGYAVVLPAAVHFLQNFNSEQFDVLVQARPYYKFSATLLLAMGLLFEIPVAVLAVTRAGVITAAQLRRRRRYAIGACALIAALLPGDPITMLMETVPPYLLFELGLLIATIAERRQSQR